MNINHKSINGVLKQFQYVMMNIYYTRIYLYFIKKTFYPTIFYHLNGFSVQARCQITLNTKKILSTSSLQIFISKYLKTIIIKYQILYNQNIAV